MLDRSPSTVSREIRRNSDHIGYLYAGEAHMMAQARRNKNVPKLSKNKQLQSYVISRLKERWSPEMIAGRWKLETGEGISKEAIYQWIYSVDGESLGLRKLLVRARKKRGIKRKVARSNIKDRVSVHTRPQCINDRLELGHYECDLIFNKGSQSKNICTLVERVTRQAILIKNDNKASNTVLGALINHLKRSPLEVKSITFDNGSEFADHTRLKEELGIDTYFCDPGAPWQKGGIENLNGMLRRFLPFKAPAAEITQKQVAAANAKINNMPRAILGYRTPLEALRNKGNPSQSRVKSARPAVEAKHFNQKKTCVAIHY